MDKNKFCVVPYEDSLQVYDGAMKRFKGLPSMSDAVEKAERHMQSILEDITADSDPEVKVKLAILQKEFQEFIQVGKNYLEDCLWMAKYAANEQHLTEIKEQLERKILDKLKEFIDYLSDYLKDCDKSFEEFRKYIKEMSDQLSSAQKDFSDQHEEAKEKAIDAVEKHEKAIVDKDNNTGLTTLFSMVSSASAQAGAMTLISPQAAFATGFFSFFQTYLAHTNEAAAVLDVRKQKRAREEMEKKEKIFQDALNTVSSLCVDVLSAASFVDTIKPSSDDVSKVIEKKRGLKDVADSNKEDFQFHDLTNKMDRLQQAAGKILKKIGKDGTSPISSKPDELVSNTRPHQTTDQGQATMQDIRKTLNIPSQPNGNFSSPSQDGETVPPLEETEQEEAEKELVGPEQAEQEIGNSAEHTELVAK
ncbi:uncharacterized protein LOC135333981 [Halichondria panicea]|uniref:uncharacterized protein LOC135333981 n=1 Tax=Halichondria panicea TaxID=6063 RepID=UPI00312BA7B1